MRPCSLLVIAAFAVAAPLAAQQPSSVPLTKQQQEAEVLAVVNRLWEAMRTRDSAMARSVFDTSARMIRVQERDGKRTISWSPVDGFVRAIGSSYGRYIVFSQAQGNFLKSGAGQDLCCRA